MKGKVSVVRVDFAESKERHSKSCGLPESVLPTIIELALKILILICIKVELPTRQKFLLLYLMKWSCGIVCGFMVLVFFFRGPLIQSEAVSKWILCCAALRNTSML